jgi:predicted nucleotidyltransferase
MELNQIKEKLNSNEYDFLRTNEHLGNNIILLTLGGSLAYGTNVENSDLDIRGIAIETKKEILGLSNFEQFDNSPTDTTIYGLRKVITLLSNCNPNTIEMLGQSEDRYFILTELGKMLLDNKDLFLTKKAIHSFLGYSMSQLRRLQNALARDNYPPSEKEKHIYNSLMNQLEELKTMFTPFSTEINLYMDKSNKEEFDEEVFIDVNMKHYPLRDFKNIYSQMGNVYNEYGKLNHRNKKKDEIHLLKHGMHLVRLLLVGTEILEGKGINTYRKDKDFLLDIRNGKYSYEEIFTMVNKYEENFKYAADNTTLPDKPNYKKIEELLMSMYEIVLK